MNIKIYQCLKLSIFINNIDSILNSNILKVKEIINKAKGEIYDIEFDRKVPDFNLVKYNEFQNIQDCFINFINTYNAQEMQKLKKLYLKI